MLAFLAYWHFKERPPTPICEKKTTYYKEHQLSSENNELINFFSGLTFDELVPYLKNTTPSDNGYTLRDLALGCLFTHHHLDVSRAIPCSNKPLQKCYFKYIDANKNTQQIAIHSGFNDNHFELIEKFIQTEKWPFTPKGLFLHLKNNRYKDKNLEYAFYITPEFMTVELLLKRTNSLIDKEEILSLLLEGGWDMLSDFFAKQRITQDLSEERRRSFLLSYIEKGSIKANSILSNEARDFYKSDLSNLNCTKTPGLNDRKSCNIKNIEGLKISQSKELPRSVDFVNKIPKIENNPIPKENSEKKFLSNIKPWKRAYTVMEGDSLWKISRMFKVDIQELKKRNNLTKDSLQPGSMIIVP